MCKRTEILKNKRVDGKQDEDHRTAHFRPSDVDKRQRRRAKGKSGASVLRVSWLTSAAGHERRDDGGPMTSVLWRAAVAPEIGYPASVPVVHCSRSLTACRSSKADESHSSARHPQTNITFLVPEHDSQRASMSLYQLISVLAE